MAHAQVCPVCNRTGKYEEKTCHGCGGKGWVMIWDERPVIFDPKPKTFHPPARSLPAYVRARWGLRGLALGR